MSKNGNKVMYYKVYMTGSSEERNKFCDVSWEWKVGKNSKNKPKEK